MEGAVEIANSNINDTKSKKMLQDKIDYAMIEMKLDDPNSQKHALQLFLDLFKNKMVDKVFEGNPQVPSYLILFARNGVDEEMRFLAYSCLDIAAHDRVDLPHILINAELYNSMLEILTNPEPAIDPVISLLSLLMLETEIADFDDFLNENEFNIFKAGIVDIVISIPEEINVSELLSAIIQKVPLEFISSELIQKIYSSLETDQIPVLTFALNALKHLVIRSFDQNEFQQYIDADVIKGKIHEFLTIDNSTLHSTAMGLLESLQNITETDIEAVTNLLQMNDLSARYAIEFLSSSKEIWADKMAISIVGVLKEALATERTTIFNLKAIPLLAELLPYLPTTDNELVPLFARYLGDQALCETSVVALTFIGRAVLQLADKQWFADELEEHIEEISEIENNPKESVSAAATELLEIIESI